MSATHHRKADRAANFTPVRTGKRTRTDRKPKQFSIGLYVDHHVDRLNIMSVRSFRNFGKNHLIGRYVKKLIGIAIIEMMMMRNIRIKKAVFIVNGDTPQQARLGKLIERIVNRANSDLQSAGSYFSS